jgi:two-component system OmpR family sensor kinase/two-component system sensor histidine kinase BaeS
LFRRFTAFAGLLALILVFGLGGLAYLLTKLFGGGGQTAAAVWLAGCGLGLALPLLAGALAVRSFRSLADPLAQVMAAADAVAEGDLSVRVSEAAPGEMGRLAQSFNRMVTEIQSADQRRRDMTADVAHELRTPLHILQGNLEGIQDGVYEATPQQVELLLDETRRLARLVDDLRTLSLAEAGQMPLARAPVDLEALLADAAVTFSGPAEAAGIELRVDIALHDGAPLNIEGDAGRLDQALGNLLANAIQHTPAGGRVTLRLEALPGRTARILVSDTGPGISPEDLAYIFDRFWRGRETGGGSGLGLAITRQLVEAHGGQIRAESMPGSGTTFTIDL